MWRMLERMTKGEASREEIDILQKEQLKFKNELEGLNNDYEKIIDDASNQIEEFMTKNKFS
jgi:molecular chaperone DnaK (HSP70)